MSSFESDAASGATTPTSSPREAAAEIIGVSSRRPTTRDVAHGHVRVVAPDRHGDRTAVVIAVRDALRIIGPGIARRNTSGDRGPRPRTRHERGVRTDDERNVNLIQYC